VAKKARLGRMVVYTFNFLLVLVLMRGLAGYWAYRNFAAAHDLRGHVYISVLSLRDLQDLLLDAASGTRAYVITGNEEDSAPFTKAKSAFEGKLSEIRRSIRHDEPEEIEEFESLVDVSRKTMEYQETIINTMKAGKHDDAAALVTAGTGIQLIESSRKKATEIIETEMSDLGPIQHAVRQAGLYALFVIVGGVVLACLAYPFLYFYFSRQIVRPLRDAATTIARVSTEIAATVEQHEKTASRPFIEDETISTIEELEFSFRRAGEAADAAGARASQAIILAEDGSKTVDQSLVGITDLKEKVSAIAVQTIRLSQQTN